MEEKNGTYYKSNHECSAAIEKHSMKQDCDCIKAWYDLCVAEALS